eukprot:CAMPEP_0115446374 /NCGR_PEP_ID=MMETSP0271-20121206/39416_1 /TAXON_ID=71861 /ORGANISM="Scrippsiella trochoidea, Strain CCMP3099" /LENGTH=37 /DNA_ID= /DNA_START= /DNA_END= /DNA_ORIENTATION=
MSDRSVSAVSIKSLLQLGQFRQMLVKRADMLMHFPME